MRHSVSMSQHSTAILQWWRHDMEMLSTLLTLCEGKTPVTGGFPSQGTNNAKLWCFFHVSLYKLLNNESSCCWSETPWRSCLKYRGLSRTPQVEQITIFNRRFNGENVDRTNLIHICSLASTHCSGVIMDTMKGPFRRKMCPFDYVIMQNMIYFQSLVCLCRLTWLSWGICDCMICHLFFNLKMKLLTMKTYVVTKNEIRQKLIWGFRQVWWNTSITMTS